MPGSRAPRGHRHTDRAAGRTPGTLVQTQTQTQTRTRARAWARTWTRPARGHAPAIRTAAGAAARFAHLLPALATVLLLAVPVAPGDVSATGKVTPADAASAVLVLACALRAVRGGRGRRRMLSGAAALVLGAPAVGFALAAATSADPGTGAAGFLRYTQVFVLVPAAVVLTLRDRRDFAVVAASIVVLALVQGGVGVWQSATGTGASYAGQDVRAVGTFGPSDVMGMATVVAYGLLIAAGYALAPGGRRALRLGALACAAALVVPLTVSYSRGTWIATAVAGTAMTVLAGRRQAVRVLGVLAACAVLLVGGLGAGSQLIGQRVASITQVTDAPDPSVTDRYTLWAAALSMWREHPLTGVGLKRFPDERDGHASLALSSGSDTAGAGQAFRREPLLSPHNMYLLALSEQGLVGCALLTGAWAALLVAGTARLARERRLARVRERSRVRERARAATVPGRGPAAARAGAGVRGPAAVRGRVRVRARVRTPAGVCGYAPGDLPAGTGSGPVAVGLVAVGLLLWTCVDFLYADIGGPCTVLTALLLGLTAWWSLHPAPSGEPAR